MNPFKLKEIGEQFKKAVVPNHPNISCIHWEMMDYNLKTNTISGELKVDLQYMGVETSFNTLKTTLLLGSMGIEVINVTANWVEQENVDYTKYSFNTRVSLEDFPEIALSNYIKDAQETLAYAWIR